MKKPLFRLILLFLTAISSARGVAAENEIRYSISYENDTISITTVKRNGKLYSNVNMGSLYQFGEVGHPLFPVEQLSFSVPFTATDFKLEYKAEKEEEITLPYPPCPTREEVDYFADTAISYDDHPDPTYRDVDLIDPKDYKVPPIANIKEDYAWYFNRILVIDVNPVRWTQEDTRIKVYRKIELIITWRTNEALLDEILGPSRPRVLENMIKLAKDRVVNPQDVEKNAPQWVLEIIRNSRSLSSVLDHTVPYVIVTTQKLVPSLERLAAFRRLRGVDTEIVSIDSILNDPSNIGDNASGINDHAGKLRAHLRDANYYNGLRNVLLAGPYPEIPGRWVKAIPIDDTQVFYVSDQYFRDLNTQWPKADSNSPGDIARLTSMPQDLNVGRISFTTSTEVDNYINKLIQYEFNIHNSDLSYLDKAHVLLPNDNRFASAYKDYSDKIFKSHFKSVLMDSVALQKFHTGKNAIDNMKKDHYGFMNWRGHGHYAGITVWQNEKDKKQYGINALDSHKGVLEEESGNGLDSYMNEQKPSWALSPSCSLAELGEKRDTYTFADSYVLGKNYGGVALIGNVEKGLIYRGAELNQYIFNEGMALYNSGVTPPFAGSILNRGLSTYFKNKYPNEKYKEKLLYTESVIGLIGDPLVPLWFRKPYVSSMDGVFSPTHLTAKDSLSVGTYDFITGKATYAQDILSNQSNSAETTNSTKIRYRADMLPYINPCLISGLALNKSRYVFTDVLRFANNSQTINRAVSLSNNADFTVEAFGKVTMTGVMYVMSGSRMTVRSYRPIVMEDCTLTSNGEVILMSEKEVVMDHDTQVDKGMAMTILKAD